MPWRLGHVRLVALILPDTNHSGCDCAARKMMPHAVCNAPFVQVYRECSMMNISQEVDTSSFIMIVFARWLCVEAVLVYLLL